MIPSARPAYSLIFAFVIMTVIMIVAGTTIQNTREKVAFYNEMEGSTQAYLSAQSAAEVAVTVMADYGPGYESSASEAFCEGSSSGSCQSWADYIILAEQKLYSSRYYTPIFGTGTAGNSEDCSVLDAIDLDTGETDTSVTIDVDDPCHWNKLMYGDSVTIPLFDIDDSTGSPLNPTDLGLTDWNLKVRTPCSDGTLDIGCTRYELDASDGTVPGEGDTIIFWQLIGQDASGNEYSLIPNDQKEENRFTSVKTRTDADFDNTEIYESLINTASNYTVFEVASSGHYELLYDFCDGDTDLDGVVDTDFTALYLQMDIVSPLIDVNNSSVPYLEWQLEVNSTAPFADLKSVMVGEGYFTGAQNTFYSSYILTRGTTGESANVYTLSN